MDENIRIRMPLQSKQVRDVYTSQDQRSA